MESIEGLPYQHQLSKISEKTVDYSHNQGENHPHESKPKKQHEHDDLLRSRKEIESILRESLMGIFKPKTRRSMVQESLEES